LIFVSKSKYSKKVDVSLALLWSVKLIYVFTEVNRIYIDTIVYKAFYMILNRFADHKLNKESK